ncbi:MAG: DUF134 domain-containing protein [Peptococcaceae bacterium]|jgi:predicted DNA-binding protein (UPF0251 family)|nr:DUF134 domain-containing protein [Peptococcaceae bacterium]MDH7524011.1 DUF134 domain-containing protein [Peptococcaceae bacterium]
MPRPPKWRRVEYEPQVTYFKPAGVPKWQLEELVLGLEEVEAIRLKDLEGLEQEEGAERMNISRPTFQRILTTARAKLADAVINGKAIRIEGGNYRLADQWLKCEACGYRFGPPFGRHGHGHDLVRCPRCGEETERKNNID